MTLLAAPEVTRLEFTGSGSEYFRIWVVNQLLTLVTLGVYSAWAKQRKLRYFCQNTRLGGFAFDFHGDPRVILRGRILVLGLFAAYTWAFEFSLAAGFVTLAVLCAAGPWLFMRAQQFKLANTSWRGLRFGFASRTSEAFRVLLPILVVWLSGTVLAVRFVPSPWWSFGLSLAPLAALPWMHHRLKAYQHGRACYGDRAFSFRPIPLRFFGVYAKGLLLVVVGITLGGCAIAMLDASGFDEPATGTASTLLYTLALVLAIYVVAGPYFAARLQQVVWSATRLGDVRFRTEIQVGTLFGLTLRNISLTLATLGLYWPFASVALARYRIECMRMEAASPIGTIVAGTQSSVVGAAGEGAADLFGLDIGL